MDSMEIAPIAGPIDRTVRVPGSKSVTNRALVLAALADGVSTLHGALWCDDSERMVASLVRLRFDVQVAAGDNREPADRVIQVQGRGGDILCDGATLHTGNAGTVARFLTAVVALGRGRFVVDGDRRMRERPIGDLADALGRLGARVSCTGDCPPVVVHANGLQGGRTVVLGGASSQFLSALLMVAPYAATPVEISWRNASSRPYVDLTVAMMSDFGIDVTREDGRFLVSPGRYRALADYLVEPDASSASYVFAAAAIVGGRVSVEGLTATCQQGDYGFVRVLQEMGCDVVISAGATTVEATGQLRGVEVDLADMPDVAPTLAAVAPFADSPTSIRGIASARRKECDRVAALCAGLKSLGVDVTEHEDGLTIRPCGAFRPALVRTCNDHRIAMAFALAGLRAPGVTIENPGCVSKTYPGYFRMLEELRRSCSGG